MNKNKVKPKAIRANKVMNKIRPLAIAALRAGDDTKLAVYISRMNRVLTIQRDANLAAGMPGERYKHQTMSEVKATAGLKGIIK